MKHVTSVPDPSKFVFVVVVAVIVVVVMKKYIIIVEKMSQKLLIYFENLYNNRHNPLRLGMGWGNSLIINNR